MLPVTHYLYLALVLFCIGLGGALLRRSLVTALLGVQLMVVAVALCLSAYARFFVDPGGQVVALLVVLVGLVELAVALAVALRARLAERGEDTAADLVGDWTEAGGEPS